MFKVFGLWVTDYKFPRPYSRCRTSTEVNRSFVKKKLTAGKCTIIIYYYFILTALKIIWCIKYWRSFEFFQWFIFMQMFITFLGIVFLYPIYFHLPRVNQHLHPYCTFSGCKSSLCILIKCYEYVIFIYDFSECSWNFHSSIWPENSVCESELLQLFLFFFCRITSLIFS